MLSGDDEGGEYVPVWPHPRFAQACAVGRWTGAEPRAIPLADWLGKWIPGMERDGRYVVAFPTPDDRGWIIPPSGMRADLEEELSLLE